MEDGGEPGRATAAIAAIADNGAPSRWLESEELLVRIVCWFTRLAGLVALIAVIVPAGRRTLRAPLASLLELPYAATVTTSTIAVAAGVGLLLLATGLRRRKQRAWQIATVAAVLTAVTHVQHRGLVVCLVSAGLVALLLVTRGQFTALPDRTVSRWHAVRVFVQMLLAGVVVNFLLLLLNQHLLLGRPPVGDRFRQAVYALIGLSGPLRFRSEFLDDLTAAVGLVFGLGAVLLGGYFLLRSAEPEPGLSPEGESRVRGLLAAGGHQDSLAYFALRGDKTAVFSATGKAAVVYRVLAGVALIAGDPLGDPEAWPGAAAEYLAVCRRYGWVPAALGCSARAAALWRRHGLAVYELGDEAVVATAGFSLDGRAMRGIRQAVGKLERNGYTTVIRRVGDIPADELAELGRAADEWRGSPGERGFSMALSRLAGPDDPDCVLVTAERDGAPRGLLQFVPWGTTGLSLDLMRRDRTADNGLNELMISALLLAAPERGIERVSLNFAMFRAAIEQGDRIGAGPVARAWARVLHLASRWWQIDTLYRFNAKFRPEWTPRYLVYNAARDLPRTALAALEAEGFGGRPPALLRLLSRR